MRRDNSRLASSHAARNANKSVPILFAKVTERLRVAAICRSLSADCSILHTQSAWGS